MPKRTRAELETRMKELEAGLKGVRADLNGLAKRSKDLVNAGKKKRDEGLIAKLRRQIGLS